VNIVVPKYFDATQTSQGSRQRGEKAEKAMPMPLSSYKQSSQPVRISFPPTFSFFTQVIFCDHAITILVLSLVFDPFIFEHFATPFFTCPCGFGIKCTKGATSDRCCLNQKLVSFYNPCIEIFSRQWIAYFTHPTTPLRCVDHGLL
jgi:hypothetical protein